MAFTHTIESILAIEQYFLVVRVTHGSEYRSVNLLVSVMLTYRVASHRKPHAQDRHTLQGTGKVVSS